MKRPKPVGLIILDGFGLRAELQGNAVAQASKPNFDRYWSEFPHATLQASGEAVGLPAGQMGNSEVGHLNIGAGRIVYQDLTRISKSIGDGDFFTNKQLVGAFEHAKKNKRKLHLLGLLSDGGVHSHMEHLFALLDLAKKEDFRDVYIHAFLDGRDVAPNSGVNYIEQLEAKIKTTGVGKIATVQGRYYAMDRDKRWDRVEKSYRAMVKGEGARGTEPLQVVKQSYEASVYDEFVLPTVMVDQQGNPVGLVEDEDAVIFFNFRPDRAVQISQALVNPEFTGFERGASFPSGLYFVCMTFYSDNIQGVKIAYSQKDLQHTYGEVVADNGLKQLRIAETEKYPHVTYFFSGGRDHELAGETRILINSPQVATYDLKPEMSAFEVAEAAVREIEAERQDAIVLNFANPDMVGHSGLLEPTVKAIEATDQCLGKVVDAILAKGGAAIIIADHGNADIVRDEEDRPHTAHTTNIVPFIVTLKHVKLRDSGILADVAPTLLDILQLAQPDEMTGKSMIRSVRK